LDRLQYYRGGPASRFSVILLVLALFVLMFAGPLRAVPAGYVGVKDCFGRVSAQTLPPGIRLVVPLTGKT
jgi:regulator of protease activity HflC (stomatin/prohibitin superfamily)